MLLVPISIKKKKKEKKERAGIFSLFATFSNKAKISCGVLQGSILGPPLFIAYLWHTSMLELVRFHLIIAN